jgi:hypothetical protein
MWCTCFWNGIHCIPYSQCTCDWDGWFTDQDETIFNVCMIKIWNGMECSSRQKKN